jgi:hypothetical protein
MYIICDSTRESIIKIAMATIFMTQHRFKFLTFRDSSGRVKLRHQIRLFTPTDLNLFSAVSCRRQIITAVS